MKVAFRTDASTHIGTGHFMRCLTLADELKKHGSYVRFLIRHLPIHLIDMLTKKGIEYVQLFDADVDSLLDDLAHSSWLGISQSRDAKATIDALSDQLWDWVVIDHYALDARWESMVRPSVKKIMVIDDLADRNHDCDLLLDQNYYAEMQARYEGKVPPHCQLLLGPRYALLRETFRSLHDHVKIRTGVVKKILVFFGGVDESNYTFKTIEVLSQFNSHLHVDVVIGAQHPFKDLISDSCNEFGFVCHVQTDRMAELMAEADFAIGAGGSATWERCCLGLPALLVALAYNQIDIAKALNSINACFYIATKEEMFSLNIKYTLTKLLDNPDQISQVSKKAFSMVDGLGVSRVYAEFVI